MASIPEEIVFEVHEEAEGGLGARAIGVSIFTQGEDLASLKAMILEAVDCHYDEGTAPKVIKFRMGDGPETVLTTD